MIERHGYKVVSNVKYAFVKEKELYELESKIESLKCCANCSAYECPHRDVHSKTPCNEEDDKREWTGES